MKKYYFTITSILVLAVVLASCSQEQDNKTQNDTASRPTIPVMANEVSIGSQIWMTKNLNVSRYRNGDIIPQVQDQTEWNNLTTGAWCYYNNNPANGPIYGKLYNWYAVNDPRGLAPLGYHIPSRADWETLVSFLGGYQVAGNKMKVVGTQYGFAPNTSASNESGFSGLPAGIRYSNNFAGIGSIGRWFLPEQYIFIPTSGYTRDIISPNGEVYEFWYPMNHGNSVRCIKD